MKDRQKPELKPKLLGKGLDEKAFNEIAKVKDTDTKKAIDNTTPAIKAYLKAETTV